MSLPMLGIEPGLRHVVENHDGFSSTNGAPFTNAPNLLLGPADCLQALRRFGPVCLLSNSHRRREVEVQRLEAMGFCAADYDDLVTVGEV